MIGRRAGSENLDLMEVEPGSPPKPEVWFRGELPTFREAASLHETIAGFLNPKAIAQPNSGQSGACDLAPHAIESACDKETMEPL